MFRKATKNVASRNTCGFSRLNLGHSSSTQHLQGPPRTVDSVLSRNTDDGIPRVEQPILPVLLANQVLFGVVLDVAIHLQNDWPAVEGGGVQQKVHSIGMTCVDDGFLLLVADSLVIEK